MRSLLFLVAGVARVPRALLQRFMQFKALALVGLGSAVAYGVLGIALAWQGLGVWSLVGAQIGSEVLASIAIWAWCPWRPAWRELDLGVGASLARFGRSILGSNLLDVLRSQVTVVLVGKLLGADLLGYYWMSRRWSSLPIEGITFVTSRVSYPAFARLRDERARFAAAYRDTLEIIVVLALPIAVGLCLVADPLVRTLYDERWLGAVLPLQILAFYGLFHAVAASTGEVFKAAGVPHLVLRYATLYALLLLALLVALGAPFGLVGVTLAWVAAPLVVAIMTVGAASRLLDLPATKVLALLPTPLLATVAMAAAVLMTVAVAHGIAIPAGLDLALRALVGAVVYASVLAAFEPRWIHELTALVSGRRVSPAGAPGSVPGGTP